MSQSKYSLFKAKSIDPMRGSNVKIPGYTGHIPYKLDLIGLTCGQANIASQD